MCRRFLTCCVAALLLALCSYLPTASAQIRSETVNSQKSATPDAGESGERTPAMQYFVAVVLSVVVLFVVCAPSRKGYNQSGDRGD